MKRETNPARRAAQPLAAAARRTARRAARLARRVLTALTLVLIATLATGLASCSDTDTDDDLGLFRPGAATTLTVAPLPGYTDAATPPAGADTRAFDPTAPIGIPAPGKTEWAEGDTLAIKIYFSDSKDEYGTNFATAYTYATYTGGAWKLGDGLTTVTNSIYANLPGAVSGGKVLWPARANSMVVDAWYAPGQTFGTDGFLCATTPAAAGRGEVWVNPYTNVTTPGAPIVLGFWYAECVRLRVAAAPGDVVKITAPGFRPTGSAQKLGDTDALTATADALGNAYFYGYTGGFGSETTTLTASLTRSALYGDAERPVFKTSKRFSPSYAPGTGRTYAINALADTELDGTTEWSNIYYGDGSNIDITTNKNTWIITGEAPNYDVLNGKLQEIQAADGARRVSITLPAATSIGEYAFSGCKTLAGISAPAATSIGNYAFSGCKTLAGISLPAATSIGDKAFDYCTSLTTLTLPAAKSIGEYAFNYCTSLAGIELPAATSIGNNAFNYCTSLAGIELPAATSIGEQAFNYCTSLTTVTLTVAASIGNDVFQNCTNLATLTLPEATSIADDMFSGYTALTTVYAPKATSVGNRAFARCTSLATVTLTAATSIGNDVFQGCGNLTTLTLTAATSIGDKAFNGCEKLAAIKLPAAKSIGNGAFGGCTSLTALTFGTPIETWGKAVLGGTTKPANITLTLFPGQRVMAWDAATSAYKATGTLFSDFDFGQAFCGDGWVPYYFGEIKRPGQ